MRRLALIAILAACGSKSEPESKPEHHEEHMSPAMTKFHDVLAPRWHAAKGAQRMKDTCAALPDFHADADALAKATPPRGANADSWTTGTQQLVGAVGELDTTCKTNDPTSFEAAFGKVHESFHGLMAAGGEQHEDHHEM